MAPGTGRNAPTAIMTEFAGLPNHLQPTGGCSYILRGGVDIRIVPVNHEEYWLHGDSQVQFLARETLKYPRGPAVCGWSGTTTFEAIRPEWEET